MKRLWRYSDLMVIENGSRLPSWIWTTIWQALQPFSSFKHFIKHLSSAVNDAMSIYKWHNLWRKLVLFIQINTKILQQTNKYNWHVHTWPFYLYMLQLMLTRHSAVLVLLPPDVGDLWINTSSSTSTVSKYTSYATHLPVYVQLSTRTSATSRGIRTVLRPPEILSL